MLGGVELGGTKVVCVAGTGPDDVVAEERIATTDPVATLGAVVDFFTDREIESLGVASFGPVELRAGHPEWGFITRTPKPGWSGTDVVGRLVRALDVPVAFNTDVNGAALAEGCWGAATGLRSFVYLTIGTGIGGGAVSGGNLVHGLVHPEMGHLPVARRRGDEHSGSCPFHAACWEGMSAGPALAARFGGPLEDADPGARAAAAMLAADYTAAGLRSIVYTLAPERIVVGGGVSDLPGFHSAVRAALRRELAGYPGLPEHDRDDYVVPPALGGRAGVLGALLLAEGVATST